MAGFSLILVMFPFIAGLIGVFIAIICLIGICLMIGGITGFVLNKLYAKETGTKETTVKNGWNYATFILGLLVFLFPLAYFIYNIVLIVFSGLS